MNSKKCLHELFNEQVLKTPNKTAIVDFNGRTLTYEQLDTKTSFLAKCLKQKGCKTDSIVGIYMERCMEFSIAYIAALKAGGCYLPIDYSYPIPLLNSVCEDAKPIVVITLSCYKKWLPNSLSIICLDEGWENDMSKVTCDVELTTTSSLDDLAYVVYSSGTTGAPKGIMCPHRGAVYSYTWRHTKYPFEEDDRVASNIFFVWEMLRPLLKGATLYIISDDVIYDPPVLLKYLKENAITRILLTPSLLEAILDERNLNAQFYLKHLKLIWLCGEVVTISLRNRFIDLLPGVKLLNLYSISECHDVSAADLSEGELEKRITNIGAVGKFCPVGKVIEGVHVVILDETLKQLPIGMPGEIYVGGPTLARCYVNRPDLTKRKFIETPCALQSLFGSRLYRTGDWGYLLSNGELEICGRCDSMVKIRGFSVEIQAVEAVLLELQLVKACKVQVHGEEGEDKYLVAYIVSVEKTSKREIRAALKAKLPGYMIPSYFVLLTSVPIAASGKLDATMLPHFEKNKEEDEDFSDSPNTPTEKCLHEIWKKILNLKHVDTQENFFDIGGHSLLAARMLSTIREEYKIKLSMIELFNNNTIVELASLIDLKTGKIKTRSTSVDVEVDLMHEVEYYDQSFINMDMMLRAFWRSCQYEHRWTTGRVFLTGSTGFLGAFLLKELLMSTKVHIYCLIREMPESSVENRLRSNLEKYGILPEQSEVDGDKDDEMTRTLKEYETRVTVIKGDVSVLHFGLTNDDYAYLSYEIDFIIHAAAVVNLVYPYKTLHGTNVVGTQNILLFAGSSKIKPVHYISTDAVFPPNCSTCDEDSDMSSLHKHLNYGYAQSKWVSEQLVLRAAKRGLPAAIYRLGNVSGESVRAYWNKSDFNLLLLLTCIHSGYAPYMDFKIEMTPVDFVSRVVVSLTQQISWSLGKVYHIINTKPIDSKHLFEWISTNGYPLSLVPYNEWKSNVEKKAMEQSATYMENTLQIMKSMDNAVVADKRVFKNTNLQKFLQIFLKTKYQYINSSLLKSYTAGLAARGIIPKPKISHPVLRPLANRVAVVTGASSGIGEAIARKLAESGATVVLAARNLDKLEKIRNELVIQGNIVAAVKVDVTKSTDLKRLVEQTEEMFGSIDILVNSAGVMYYTMMKNFHLEEWERQVDVNCKGVMNSIGAFLPGMLRQESGHIINISSDAGRKVFPGLTVYSASKFFVEALSQGLRLETANTGVKVTTIQPGDVRTSLFQLTTDEEAKNEFAQTNEELFLEPDDIANAVLYAVTQPRNCSVNEILIEPRQCPI